MIVFFVYKALIFIVRSCQINVKRPIFYRSTSKLYLRIWVNALRTFTQILDLQLENNPQYLDFYQANFDRFKSLFALGNFEIKLNLNLNTATIYFWC